jgi:membrane-associated protease RseP (regulator of RpoE activity)
MGALPIIQAKLLLRGRAAIDIACAIDSGASGVHLTAPFVRENDLMASLTKTIAASSLGAGGESVEIAARVDGLQLGPYLLRRPIVEISPDPKEGLLANPELGGLLGGEILGRFTVTFDYPHRRILLEPNRLFPDPFLADQSGLSILARGPGFHRFEIDGVEPNSPADAAGILRGDVIVAVDSHPAMELDLDRMGRLLERTGRTILVTVERDGRALDFSLDLKERL